MSMSNAEKQKAYRERNLFRMKDMQKAVHSLLRRCDDLKKEVHEVYCLIDSVRDHLIKS